LKVEDYPCANSTTKLGLRLGLQSLGKLAEIQKR